MEHVNTYTVAEYYKLIRCRSCGKFQDKKNCPTCKNLKTCKLCGIVLRTGEYELYCSDIKDDQRNLKQQLLKRVKPIREYKYITTCPYPPHNEKFCKDCLNWESKLKSQCFICNRSFMNSFEHFKKHGNCCNSCNTSVETRLKAKIKLYENI